MSEAMGISVLPTAVTKGGPTDGPSALCVHSLREEFTTYVWTLYTEPGYAVFH